MKSKKYTITNQKFRKNNKKLRKNNKITKKKTRKNNKITNKSKKNKYRKRIQKIMKGGEFDENDYNGKNMYDKIKYLTAPNVLYPNDVYTRDVKNKYLFIFNQFLFENTNNNYYFVLEINENFNTELLKLEDFKENKIFYDLLKNYIINLKKLKNSKNIELSEREKIELPESENIELPESKEFLENNESNNIKKFYICLQCSINSIKFYDKKQFEIFITPENFLKFTPNPIYIET